MSYLIGRTRSQASHHQTQMHPAAHAGAASSNHAGEVGAQNGQVNMQLQQGSSAMAQPPAYGGVASNPQQGLLAPEVALPEQKKKGRPKGSKDKNPLLPTGEKKARGRPKGRRDGPRASDAPPRGRPRRDVPRDLSSSPKKTTVTGKKRGRPRKDRSDRAGDGADGAEEQTVDGQLAMGGEFAQHSNFNNMTPYLPPGMSWPEPSFYNNSSNSNGGSWNSSGGQASAQQQQQQYQQAQDMLTLSNAGRNAQMNDGQGQLFSNIAAGASTSGSRSMRQAAGPRRAQLNASGISALEARLHFPLDEFFGLSEQALLDIRARVYKDKQQQAAAAAAANGGGSGQQHQQQHEIMPPPPGHAGPGPMPPLSLVSNQQQSGPGR
ncbi:hypothetical protein K437DRAFT_259338 [Tilletiaria anomala UBC 951]|uniref:Uncharacterized protein n=1 Tax=Tilletiaria anomala (strain ATCC 24038 / CBS 436.72 / UBC 951) TaxID=1037660 RepID=A0A066VAY4_TILAU|nr:uncharacterized protein K437DRAFT_259338 [Tilletiaria anomala UBC 951]KDN38641.1 hypothetical protein K437DRAFT_259338 [Tilletiaria anomala UBC 951]